MLSGRALCDELITRPEESYRLCCIVVCDLETSRIGISSLKVKAIDAPIQASDIFDLTVSLKIINCSFQIFFSFCV